MISWWWLIVAFFGGVFVTISEGVFYKVEPESDSRDKRGAGRRMIHIKNWQYWGLLIGAWVGGFMVGAGLAFMVATR